MSTKISAGEAYVSVSCNNTLLLRGLQDASAKIKDAARAVAKAEPELSPKVRVEGLDAFKTGLESVRQEIEKTAKAGSSLSQKIVITAGDVHSLFSSVVSKISQTLGGIGDEFDEMSARTGVSTSALSEYAYAAKQSGADASAVESALSTMAVRLVDAQNGSSKAAKAFERLGVDFRQLALLGPEEQFEELALAIASVGDPTERAGLAVKVFGESGRRLLPLFAAGSGGLRELREEARALGVSVDETAAKSGAEFADAMLRFKTAVTGAGLALGEVLAPVITEAANRLARLIGAITTAARENPVLTGALVGTGAALLSTLNDIFFAADLLWLICKEQAEARGIDAETFGTLLRGELLFEAVGAFTEEYLDFFPDPTVAKKMRALVGTLRDAQTALCETICGKTETFLREALEDAETAFGTPSSTRSESAAESAD